MSRFSLVTEETAKNAEIKEMEKRLETQRILDQVHNRAKLILQILVESAEFQSLYLCQNRDEMHIFSHSSKRIIVIDALTRCTIDQVANFDTFDFTAHPKFEKRISKYTRTTKKPNPSLSKCRSWDVALNVILKVEALDAEITMLHTSRLLFREYTILKYTWDCYLRELMELDEMTGIPMVFDYTEVPNTEFNYERFVEYKVVDIFGTLMPWKSENLTTMSYLCMEKLGPNTNYLQELMFFTKRKSRTFDFETSFKIFDQVLCRCLQLHRFGVVHNCIEPRNIYFGRSATFNVVYLANYGKSIILDSRERKVADTFIGGDQRYASFLGARGSPVDPFHDLESAFYCLLSMIVGSLPWDAHLRGSSSPKQTDATGTHRNSSNTMDGDEVLEVHPRVREVKANFWKNPAGITRVLADTRYLIGSGLGAGVNLTVEIIKDLYTRLRDYLQTMKSRLKGNAIITALMSPQSPEYQFYVDLRRSALLFFRFESISAFLCTPTYQKKIEMVAREEQEVRPAWNISNWCFNSVLMNAPGNIRLSMMPIDFPSRTVN